MKYIYILLLLIFLINGNVFADDIFVKAGSRADSPTEVNLLSSDNSKTVVQVRLNGFYNKKIISDGSTYDNIYLNDFVSLGNSGEAALPTITKIIAIPNYKDVKVKINSTETQTFESYDVYPYQTPPLRNTNAVSQTFQKDNLYYSSNDNLPAEIVSIQEIAVLRDYRVAVVTINPVQYNPALRQLKVYTDINFELTYEGYSNVNNVTHQTSERSRSFENLYKQLIFNYTDNSSFTVPPKLLIVIADSLEQSIVPFAQWKEKKGIKTTIVKLSQINGTLSPTADQIKGYLTAIYNGSDRQDFVLLVGDAAGINTITWFNATGGKSDHPYQCLDGSDVLPDIMLGRISVQTRPELDTAVAKLIQYEKQPNLTQTDWYKRALVLHSNDGIDPINGEVAKNVFINEGGFASVDIASPVTTQGQITNFINGGVSWIWFIGHGTETSWGNPVWNMSNMVNLNFGYRQPSIISIACSNTDLDYSTTADCFGEAFIERSSQNSASNFTGSTELCAFYTTDTLGREMLYAYFRHGIYDFGSMLNYGKIQAYIYFNGNGTVVETINQYMILGDPTQEAYSDVPKNLSIMTSLTGTEYKVNVKANAAISPGALVAVSQENVLKTSGYTDNSGNYSFSSSNLQEGIPVNLVVTGKNLAPYDGNMTLTAVNNLSEIPQSFSLSQNYPNPFNPKTIINYQIANSGLVSLKVFDVLGNEVTTIVNERQDRGNYQVEFDGNELSSGTYFYKIDAGQFSEVKRMTLIK